MKQEKSCGAIIFRKNKELEFLIIQENLGHWYFPKGHVEPGENEEETAKREINEELNIKEITFIKGFREINKYQSAPDMMKTAVFFLAEMPIEELNFNKKEIKDAKWLDFKEAKKQLNHEESRQLLAKANEWIKNL